MTKQSAGRGGVREGAGRKMNPDGPAVVITASVPKGLADELDAYVKANEVTRSGVIVEALRGLLKRKTR